MIALHVNVDHIATIRQARQIREPDPVTGALLAELAGADGITVHLREDRRHIQQRDVQVIRETVQTYLNLEMAATEEMFAVALSIKPDIVTLVPEKREEITTEGGLDLTRNTSNLHQGIEKLKNAGIRVSLFIDPAPEQIEKSKAVAADDVELHTGAYANSTDSLTKESELARLKSAALLAHDLRLQVNAGHGLNYQNVQPVCHLPHLKELNIGHSIISRSIFVGITEAVKEMRTLIQTA
ncbi:MAG: pyridoxine 5'-phosphate synthase [SAR324 cluster bacterium]|nr:pyridoxine 5'-phosphate synthase [SAR324 cluster bacterium]